MWFKPSTTKARACWYPRLLTAWCGTRTHAPRSRPSGADSAALSSEVAESATKRLRAQAPQARLHPCEINDSPWLEVVRHEALDNCLTVFASACGPFRVNMSTKTARAMNREGYRAGLQGLFGRWLFQQKEAEIEQGAYKDPIVPCRACRWCVPPYRVGCISSLCALCLFSCSDGGRQARGQRA